MKEEGPQLLPSEGRVVFAREGQPRRGGPRFPVGQRQPEAALIHKELNQLVLLMVRKKPPRLSGITMTLCAVTAVAKGPL